MNHCSCFWHYLTMSTLCTSLNPDWLVDDHSSICTVFDFLNHNVGNISPTQCTSKLIGSQILYWVNGISHLKRARYDEICNANYCHFRRRRQVSGCIGRSTACFLPVVWRLINDVFYRKLDVKMGLKTPKQRLLIYVIYWSS